MGTGKDVAGRQSSGSARNLIHSFLAVVAQVDDRTAGQVPAAAGALHLAASRGGAGFF
ncbi:hypothetical protein BAE44_0021996 [Dichanthelium oligosanthes]|uniref:Uncharacterized protein n=1 Tax=Dichanthelium oligosanthes TaxID=888268 RepID=A0A1E5UVS2_9POAL|nr:hypothetical protein BAE44_0021996 [Dichanthelium oligosanthes]